MSEVTLSALAAQRRSAENKPVASVASDSDTLLLAVQKQHEEDLRKLKAAYSKRIEGFALDVLDSYLEGADWEAAFAGFFRRNAAIFADFDAEQGGFDLPMTEVHSTFLTTLDGLLDAQLSRLDLSAQRCVELLGGSSGGGDGSGTSASAALTAVRAKLVRYTDFLQFGEMMHARHAEHTKRAAERTGMQGSSAGGGASVQGGASGAGGDDEAIGSPASAAGINGGSGGGSGGSGGIGDGGGGGTAGSERKFTRVLWDIENMRIPTGVDPLEAVYAIESWLTTLGYWGLCATLRRSDRL